jgi:hypothetical protein
MNISKKWTEIKQNFKLLAKKPLGQAGLLISSIGLGLSLLPLGTISSISIYLSAFHMLSLLVTSMLLVFIMFSPEKILSEDIEVNKNVMKQSIALFGIGVFGIFLNMFLDHGSSILNTINFVILISGFMGLQLSSSNVFKSLDNPNEKRQKNNVEIEKLPLTLSKPLDEEKELELTHYFKK